ncbi:MAG: HNH endonuclease signature motif containing protein, partial [Humibacter sp.]
RSGRALNLGRTRRLFSPAQRVILRARDGGCLWPGCDRPPWQTEAHHIDNYAEHHGRTDIADGVSLCKFHHLNLHNNHWHIRRHGTHYELIPPTEMNLPPIPLHPKSTTWEQVRQHTG